MLPGARRRFARWQIDWQHARIDENRKPSTVLLLLDSITTWEPEHGVTVVIRDGVPCAAADFFVDLAEYDGDPDDDARSPALRCSRPKLTRRPASSAPRRAKKGFWRWHAQGGQQIFAMVSSRGAFVLKLPRERVASLVATGQGQA